MRETEGEDRKEDNGDGKRNGGGSVKKWCRGGGD